MIRSRRTWLALGTVASAVVVPVMAMLAVDVHLHHKFERGVLYNVWGYRGPAVGRKQPGEYRIAVLGGSAAFGFGVRWEESMPALLEDRLVAHAPQVRVVNLAYNSQGAYAFTATMHDYAYLRADLVIFDEGYNDLLSGPAAPTQFVFRRASPVFRLTGYLPIFPIVAREKASVLRYGDTRAVYAQAQHAHTVFTPSLATKTAAALLQSAAAIGDSLERQFDHVASAPAPIIDAHGADASGCRGTWVAYCGLVYEAIRWARARHMQVLVVTQPYLVGARLRAAHVAQQQEMASMIARDFGTDPDVRYVNLGEAVDLTDPALSFDRMHLTARGNDRIAAALTAPVLAMRARLAAAPR